MIHIIVTLKGRTVGRFDLEGGVVRIGRHPDNEVQIDNMSVSRFHCRLDRRNPGWELEDHGSHNGTYLNGARVEKKAAVRSGDVLGVGQFHVTVSVEELEARKEGKGLISINPTLDPETRETSAVEKAFLIREAGAAIPLTRDVTQVGSLPDAGVFLAGPRKRAIIVRGYGGFQVVNVDDPQQVLLNDEAVTDRAWLSDGDKLQIGELKLTFFRGLADGEHDESTMTIQVPDLPL